ncbi:hypothetical protein AMJ57_01115 [Parcubacteria bacterium SG8_24]|nr:MAG: hypothetical protein AMJ57_01115 [Parcubacteria bacterium SG8_24]
MGAFWHDYLYTPLLNFLMFLYNGPAFGNMGVAIIELTVLLRLVLLPLSVLDERNRFRYEKLNRRIAAIERDFKADPVKRKEMIRQMLKEHRVNYWSKVFLLGVQAVVLVLLYQVFVSGVRFTRHEMLYAWVRVPDQVNTFFLGFDLAEKSVFWPGVVAVLLFVNTYTVQKQREHLVTKSDVMYLMLFPVFTFVVLMILPTVKSIFVLTSMVFTMIVFAIRKTFFRLGKEPPG